MTFENTYIYMLPGCPYCAKVDRFFKKHDIEMEYRNVNEGTNAQDLIELGGMLQAPCLVEDGVAMYESDDIIAHFCQKLGIPKEEVSFPFGFGCPL